MLAILILSLLAFGLPIGKSLSLIFQGAFGDPYAWSRTLGKTTPLILCGLGVVIAWRAGLYNIGGEGQFVLGALMSACWAKWLVMPGWGYAGILALLVASCVGGALWAAIAAWLYIKRGVEAVISTLLLNFVAIQLLEYAVSGPLQEAKRQVPQTDGLAETLMLAKFNPQADLHYGVVVAVLVAVGVFIYLFRTKDGFRLRVVGDNPNVARANRFPTSAIQFRSLMLSGGLCGLAGGVELLGITGYLGKGFPQQLGFLAIPVALLAGLHPLWVLLSAFYFGALFAGTQNLASFTPAGTTLVYVIQGAAVLGLVGLRYWTRRPRRSEAD
ncbi:MAG: ABC transporter permease [Chlorobia bacterium]|nr:ABC transporter permease [Fimbriimonadaceae bacterium]